MERIVASETGIGIGDPLNFGVMQVVDLARVATLSNYLVTICRDLNDPQPCFDGHVGRLAGTVLALIQTALVIIGYAAARLIARRALQQSAQPST